MPTFIRSLLLALLALATAAPALAQEPDDEGKVRAVIADWYRRVGQAEAEAPWILFAPGGFDEGPGYSVPADLHSGAAGIRGPFLNNELAGRALKFAYDVDLIRVDEHLAKVRVWERGYFYAWAAQKTYELAASTLFVLEKQPGGDWLILVHQANSQGIPPNKITDPMPDLKGDYYKRCGDACDPVSDANKASEF